MEHDTRTSLRILFQAFTFFSLYKRFRKIAKRLLSSVYPSAWNKQLGSHWTGEGNISLSSSWNEKYFRQIFGENQSAHFMFNNIFSENRAAYETM